MTSKDLQDPKTQQLQSLLGQWWIGFNEITNTLERATQMGDIEVVNAAAMTLRESQQMLGNILTHTLYTLDEVVAQRDRMIADITRLQAQLGEQWMEGYSQGHAEGTEYAHQPDVIKDWTAEAIFQSLPMIYGDPRINVEPLADAFASGEWTPEAVNLLRQTLETLEEEFDS